MRFILRLRLPRIAFPVALFPGSYFEFPKMLPQCLAHQCGTVPFGPARGSIGGLQKLLI